MIEKYDGACGSFVIAGDNIYARKGVDRECRTNKVLPFYLRVQIFSFPVCNNITIYGTMRDWCFRPRFCSVKAILGRRPGRMR